MGENRPSHTQSPPEIVNPNWIPANNWVAIEEPIREILNCIHPTLDSEEKRKDVIDYIQQMMRHSVGVKVFPYGSVPLKTYLPDGDIDLTVLYTPSKEDHLPEYVLSFLRYLEEQNENTKFELKEIQFIDAEVKLVKFIIQDIVIDLSFNQLGGLCSLGFLERIDRLIGRDHIFKRSILLIKTWCYYESHLLGAHHGLVSTYALEIVVLYIFNLFGATLTSPFMVLYRFLDYFSNFDWEKYCISLHGPVIKGCLPRIVVENRIHQGAGGLLSGECLNSCVDMFMVPLKVSERNNVQAFPIKPVNIVDPLRGNNNVGRSVGRGNLFRIKSALKYGASKLREILESPTENVGIGIKRFFLNTLQNHKSRCKLDATFRSLSSSSFSDANYDEENADLEDYTSGTNDAFRSLNLNPANELADGDMNFADSRDANGGNGETENLNPLADLTGDYDSHVRSLVYGQMVHGYNLSSALIGTGFQASFYGGFEPWEGAANRWNGSFQPSSSGPQMNPGLFQPGSSGRQMNPGLFQPGSSGRQMNPGLFQPGSSGTQMKPGLFQPGSSGTQMNPGSFQPGSSGSQMNPKNAVNRNAPYLAGQNVGRWDDRNTVRGTGTYFPVTNSASGRGRQRGHLSGGLNQQQWIRRGPPEDRGNGAINRGPVNINRDPADMNRGRVDMNQGPPVAMDPGSVDMNQGSEASHEGPGPSERSSPPSHGHDVSSSSQVNRRRKLEFGTFGSVP